MAGVENYKTPQIIDGQSFMEQLKNEESIEQQRPLFWHYPNEWGPTGPGIGAFSAVRQGDWKLIYYHDDESFELFNLDKDIAEMNNVISVETVTFTKLSKLLTEYLQSVDAQMPSHKATG